MGNPLTSKALRKHLNRFKPKLVFLIETKQKSSYMEMLRSKMGFDHGSYMELLGNSSGLGLWWNGEWRVKIQHMSKHFIDVLITHDGLWHFTGVYGDPRRELRTEV